MPTATRPTALQSFALSHPGQDAQRIGQILATVAFMGSVHVRVDGAVIDLYALCRYCAQQAEVSQGRAATVKSEAARRECHAAARKWLAIKETLKAVKESNAKKWK